MQSALRLETKVLPGNKIEIELPPETAVNAVGKTIEVILLLPNSPAASTAQSATQSVQELLVEIHGQRPVGRSVEAINRDLQAERDAWDD